MKTILEAIDLTKVYKVGKIEVPALKGVSLKVREGEFISIMGPSGCGKSTLLHTLGGLCQPTSGKIIIDGEEISSARDAVRTDIRRRKIGFVFQRFNLLPTLTAKGNLEIAREIYGNGRDDQDHIDQILVLLGLENKVRHKPLELSGGEQQRVAIARAIINKPSILLADEATGNLDTRTSLEVMDLFQQLNQTRGITVLLITHEMDIAEHATRIMSFRDGQVLTDRPVAHRR